MTKPRLPKPLLTRSAVLGIRLGDKRFTGDDSLPLSVYTDVW